MKKIKCAYNADRVGVTGMKRAPWQKWFFIVRDVGRGLESEKRRLQEGTVVVEQATDVGGGLIIEGLKQ